MTFKSVRNVLQNVAYDKDYWTSIDDNNMKEPREYTTPSDPLALISYWRKTNYLETIFGLDFVSTHDYSRLLTNDLDEINFLMPVKPPIDIYATDEESNKEAQIVRDYYIQKLGMLGIMIDRQLTDYNKALAGFLSKPIGNFNENDIGIIVKLHQFYEEDIAHDELKDTYESVPYARSYIDDEPIRYEGLHFVKKITQRRGNQSFEIYWLSNQYNHLMSFRTGRRNYLRPFLDSAMKKPITVKGYTNIVPIHPNSEFMVHTFADKFEILP